MLHVSELLKYLSDVEGLHWIRLHYAYPSKFPLDILDVMREREDHRRQQHHPAQLSDHREIARVDAILECRGDHLRETVTALALMGLLPRRTGRIATGSIRFDGPIRTSRVNFSASRNAADIDAVVRVTGTPVDSYAFAPGLARLTLASGDVVVVSAFGTDFRDIERLKAKGVTIVVLCAALVVVVVLVVVAARSRSCTR